MGVAARARRVAHVRAERIVLGVRRLHRVLAHLVAPRDEVHEHPEIGEDDDPDRPRGFGPTGQIVAAEQVGPKQATIGNHLALTVHGLPTDANPEGRWYVDTGLGDAVHAPLPLVPGTYAQGPSVFAIGGSDGVGHWSFGNDPAGSFAGVSVIAAPVSLVVFDARHEFNATSPDSSFARTVTAQRRRADGFDIVRGCVLTSRGTSTSPHTFDHRADWLDALGDMFGIRLTVPSQTVDRLWTRVRDAHNAWLDTAAGQLAVAA